MSDVADAIAPLPRGRHNLTRDEVERSQRLRLAVAMAEACADAGFAATPVKAVLERAGVSRLTFYELYDGKLDCFLEALDLVGAVLVDQLRSVLVDDAGTAVERATRVVDRYLDSIVENPAFARLYIVEVHAAGTEALTTRATLQARIVDTVIGIFEADNPERRFACEAYVAAVSALVTLPVATGDLDAVRALRDPLVSLLSRLAQP